MAVMTGTEPQIGAAPSKARRFRRPRNLFGLVVGGGIVLLVIVCAFAAGIVSPHNPYAGNLLDRLNPPAWMPGGSMQNLLGADEVGRDLLSRIIYGARVSLLVSTAAVAMSLVIGVTLWLAAGYFGGFVETVVMRLVDVTLGFPFVLVAIMVVALWGPGLGKLILVLGGTGWAAFARIVRAEVLSLKRREFVEAARAVGAGNGRILLRHIFPQVLPSVIVVSTISIATNILLESGLSYIGLGVEPTIPSWGGMLADGQLYITTAWWVATFPGLAIMITVLGFNLLGDWVRDYFDPHLQNVG